jgi:hypothetical protein
LSRYGAFRDGGKSGEQAFIQFINALIGAEVATGFAVSQQGSPTMGVAVSAGTAAIQTGNGYPYIAWSTASENVTLNTADGSNPRIDLIVAYWDLSVVSSSSSNNPNAWSFLKVTGTPSGSPAVPNAAAIQAALPNSSYPYIILAQIAVAAGATTITNSNITDLRNLANLTNITNASQSWTPSWTNLTVGSGTLVAKYKQIGKMVFVRGKLILSSTTISGIVAMSLPVKASSDYVAEQSLGEASFIDTGNQVYAGKTRFVDTATVDFADIGTLTGSNPVNTTANAGNRITTAAPFAWGNGDVLTFQFMYEAA